MKKIYFCFIVLVLFVSCNKSQKSKYVYFEHLKDLVLPLSDTLNNVVYNYQYVKTDTSNLLIIYTNSRKLLIYDIDSAKKVNTIKLSMIPLLAFDYINSDSIFIYYNPAYDIDYMHDSTLLLINNKGDTVDVYSWKNTPVWSWENPDYDIEDVGYSSLLFQHLPYMNNKIYMTFDIYHHNYFCDSIYLNNNKIPLIGYFDTKNNKFSAFSVYKYPQLTDSLKFPDIFSKKFISFTSDKKMIMAFAYTPLFFIFDEENNEIYHKKIVSMVIDTIYPSSVYQEDLNRYTYLIYDSVSQYYYRFIELAQNKYGRGMNYVVVSDKNFNHIAEGFYPKNISPQFATMGENILTINFEKTAKMPGKLVFSIYKPVFKDIDDNLTDLMMSKLDSVNQCFLQKNNLNSDRNIETFIEENISLPDSDFLLIILPMKSCPTCLKSALNFISMNAKPIFKSNLKILISGADAVQINEILADYNLLLYNNKIWIDTIEKYYYYNKFDIINPRLIFFKDKKISFDTVYIPDRMRDFKLKIKYFVEQ